MEKEIWKSIYGKYEISNFGNVRKVNSTNEYDKRTRKYFYLKDYISSCGYKRIFLKINNKQKAYLVHRLVAEAFIPNPNNFPIVNHKDENKTNNNATNLEWCSIKYNNNYGNHNKKVAIANQRKISQYDLKNNLIKNWGSIKQAGETLNICKTSISCCLAKKRKTAGGFVWRYNYD